MSRLWSTIYDRDTQLKVLILKDDENQLWLHINRIQKIHTHKYNCYFEISIQTIDGFTISIHDHHMDVFMPILDNFVKSDKQIKILKVVDLKIGEIHAFMRTNDWITNVVKG